MKAVHVNRRELKGLKMAKRKKKAKPRRRRTVVTPPTQCDVYADDIQVLKQKWLAVLYEGLNSKEEILERWQR